MKKKITPFLFTAMCCVGALLFGTAATAQQTVTGKVVDSTSHQPVAGATIQIKGSSTGTVTGSDGSFSITVPGANSTLVVSYLGFKTQEVSVGNRNSLTIDLAEDLSSLSEVIVTGYTSQRKADITGAVSTVKSEDIVAIPSGNAEQQLQGRVAGLTVLTSGEPGSTSQVRIRGFGSFTNNNPLYVVDGVPVYSIEEISSHDIETLTVLKDAATASVYGARASSGVILITTKKGKPGKLTVNYDASYGWQYPGHGFDLLNPQQTADWTWNAAAHAGEDVSKLAQSAQYGTGAKPVLPDYIKAGDNYGLSANDPAVNPDKYNLDPDKGPIYQIVKANKAGTDWYDEVTRVAPIQTHHLGLSGGTDHSAYYVGLNYYNQQGVVMNTYLKRYTIRANTEFNVKDRVKLGENFQIGLIDNPQISGGGNQNEGNAISMSYRENPLIPVYDIKGGFAGTAAKGFNNPQNPVAMQIRAKDNTTNGTYIFGNVFGEVSLPLNLTLRSSFGGLYFNYFYNNFTYKSYENAENNSSYVVGEGGGYNRSWVWTNTLNFKKQIHEHSVNVIVGTEAINSGQGWNLGATGLNPFSINIPYRSISTTQATGRQVNDNGSPGNSLFSIFGKADYNYAGKYILSGTLRRDGSSNFGLKEKYGVFPAVSAGWRISGEQFMQGLSWVNDFKVRGGWGEMGNQQVPLTNQFNLYGTSASVGSYDISGTNNSVTEGLISTGYANPAGHWETNVTTNIGFDASLFNNTFDIVFDWYKKLTKDLLYNPEVEATAGYLSSYPYINIGSIQNKGVDLNLKKRGNISKNWKYEAEVIFTTYKTNIIRIAEGVDYFDGPSFGSGRIGTFTRNAVGHPLSAFFGYKVAGLWQSQEEINATDALAQKKSKDADATYQSGGEFPGEFRYADVNGDSIITTDDRTFFGSPNPDFTYGLNLTLGYKNLELKVFFSGVQGADIINYTRWFTDFYPSFPGAAISSRVLDSWTPQHTNTNVPIFEDRGTFSTNQVPNSYYMENGSYFRCRDIELGYTFNRSGLLKLGIESLRIYAQAINLFTITKYDGLDPAISGVDTNFGVDYGNYPFTKQLIFGLNVSF